MDKTQSSSAEIRLLASAKNGPVSILEFTIHPGERTPVHYHDLFAESFEILKGQLRVGKNGTETDLMVGEKITIEPGERHFFLNNSDQRCVVCVTVKPGNENFEQALLISKGLAKDGLAGKAGTPKRLKDLALFVHLNNSRMTGFQKLAAPLFQLIAHKAIKNGYLKQLLKKYVDG